MPSKIYHQVGHCSTWCVESLVEDRCGDGLILSPVHQTSTQVAALPLTTRRRSLFDPQFYLPNSPKRKLATYEFFPEVIANGYTTSDFPHVAFDAAKLCVDFQLQQQFEGIVIPARFENQMSPRYFDRQHECTVDPFLKYISSLGVVVPVYLTLPITSAMLKDADFSVSLLNWVTSFPEITGVYVVVNDERPTKQIQSSELLTAYLNFARELRDAKLRVLLGHLNTESVVLSLVDDVSLTMGSFENTRMFTLDKFLDSEEERRGPKARIYLPSLLNWIQFGHARDIRNDNPKLWAQLYAPSEHAEGVFASLTEPYFNQPSLYKLELPLSNRTGCGLLITADELTG